MKNLATTYRVGKKECTLHFSDADLRVLMKEKSRFISVIGIFDNFTVAGGQDTEAWVRQSIHRLRESATELASDAEGSGTGWPAYLMSLDAFLEGEDEEDEVFIRHHYAWWYPKWVDMFRAGLQ